MELLWLIFTFIMSRIVVSYSKAEFVSNFYSDVIIQLLHILTFAFLIFGLLSSQSKIYRLSAIYPSYHLICCIFELFLDFCDVFRGDKELSDESTKDNIKKRCRRKF